jgi:hypothetical protein
MAPSYLKYLETSPAPHPSPSAVARLADALGTSAGALAGAALETPPGARPPVQHPVAEPLATPSELETVRSLGVEPWAGGDKDTYLRIEVTEMTGRRIRAAR